MIVGDGHDVVDQSLQNREGVLAQVLCLGAVRNGPGGLYVNDAAGAQALLAVVAGLRFDADQTTIGIGRLRSNRTAGQQATAAEGHDQQVEVVHLLEHLHRHGALPCNDTGMVVGRDQHEAPLRGESPGQLLAVFPVPVVPDNLGAVPLRCGHLAGRGILRHHDDRWDAE